MMPQLHLRHATEGVAVHAAPAADAVYALPMKLDHTGQICGEAEVIVDEEAAPTKLQCHACRSVFGAPAGATLVQCPTCNAPNRVPASAAPPQHVRVVVPAGCGPGSTFHIALPGSGERLLVRVPPGYGPNSTLTVAARPSIEKQLQAPTRGIPVDTTGDGRANAIGFDTNGDGRINALDTTGDGNIDTLLQA